ncbi:MAG TPA: hypothetical protein VD913_06455 [bacterium]|nr:hypothetical protein [bacterium]
MNLEKTASLYRLLLGLIVISGMATLYVSMGPWGIGVSEDSISYISGARAFLKGMGFRHDVRNEPITYFPPLYSLALAGVGLFGLKALEAAKVLQTLLFGVNAFLIAYFLRKITGSLRISLAGAWLFMTANAMFVIHTMAWSEPLFFSMIFPGFYFLRVYLTEGKKRYLFLACALMGLSCLVRYAGVSVVASGVLMILLLHKKDFRHRLKLGICFLAIGLLPLGLCLLRNYLSAEKLINRDLSFHVPTLNYFQKALNTITTWILPVEFPASVRLLVFCTALFLLIGVLLFIVWKEFKFHVLHALIARPSLGFMAAMIIFLICNAAMQVAHLFLLNVNTMANDRHYSPFFVASLFIALILCAEWVKAARGSRVVKGVLILLFAGLTSFNLFALQRNVKDMTQNGRAFTSREWQTSPTISKVKTLPENTLIYSNDPSIIYINTGRPASRLPRKFDKQHSRKQEEAEIRGRYPSQLRRVGKNLQKKDGYIVFFLERHRWYKISQKELEKVLPVKIQDRLADGIIYQANPQ